MNRLLAALPLILGACASGPAETPACSVLGITDVEAALANVAGYTFAATGTSLTLTPRSNVGAPPFEYQPAPIELRGAYRAPDRSRVEVVVGGDVVPPLSAPAIFFLGADAIVVVGDRTWLVSRGGVAGEPSDSEGGANLLLELLHGAPEAGDVRWTGIGACSFRGEQRQDHDGLGSLSSSVQVEVGAGGLPRRIVEERTLDLPGQPRREYTLTYVPAYGQVPEIVQPTP